MAVRRGGRASGPAHVGPVSVRGPSVTRTPPPRGSEAAQARVSQCASRAHHSHCGTPVGRRRLRRSRDGVRGDRLCRCPLLLKRAPVLTPHLLSPQVPGGGPLLGAVGPAVRPDERRDAGAGQRAPAGLLPEGTPPRAAACGGSWGAAWERGARRGCGGLLLWQ